MKFYSEKLNKLYDSAELCQKAEKEAIEAANRERVLAERKAAEEKAKKEQAAAERKAMAAKIEEKRKALIEVQHKCSQEINVAQKDYRDAIDEFVKKWGSYHYTSHSVDDIPTIFNRFSDFIDNLL